MRRRRFLGPLAGSLDVPLVGEVLDATVISRQRRAELDAQFDYLETVAGTE